jgi:ubiquinone/menaquinone biosynthesis C-methylase UbiE
MHPTGLMFIGLTVVAVMVLIGVSWRYVSRIWVVPCPSIVGWALESPFYSRITGTEKTLHRIGMKPGQRILEIGPGPGRLLIPAAQRVLPGGVAVGIDIQPGMVQRLIDRAKKSHSANVTAILGDATKPIVQEASFDVAFLVTTLGEIPDRSAALAQCFRALKPGGILSVTEMLPDPHYQSKRTVRRLAEEVGFRLDAILGGVCLFTANFVKPTESVTTSN